MILELNLYNIVGLKKILDVIIIYLKIQFKHFINYYTDKAESFEQICKFYNSLDFQVGSYFSQYDNYHTEMYNGIINLIQPFEPQYIEWLINKIDLFLLTCNTEQDLKLRFETIEFCFEWVKNMSHFCSLYEFKFIDRNSQITRNINMKNE